MIDLNTAVETVKEHFHGAQPKEAYMYKDKFYMIVAPQSEKDMNDPFYIVDIATGKYRFLNPLEDMEAFNEALENGRIKSFESDNI